MSFMVSEIRNEDRLKLLIEEIKCKNEYNKLKKEFNIYIDFEPSNSEKIKYISNFILNNFIDDNYNYIFIIHINRNFNTYNNRKINNNESIYSLLDFNPSINQVFIDNLNGNSRIVLKDLLTKNIKQILKENIEEMNLSKVFNKAIINNLTKELNDKNYDNNIIEEYINELQNFMNEEETIKGKIIETAYKLIDNYETFEQNCKDIIDKIYNNNYINKDTIDITSCLIEYIKDNIFNSYIKKVLLKLENNNILTTLIDLKTKDKNLVKETINKYLDKMIIENESKA